MPNLATARTEKTVSAQASPRAITYRPDIDGLRSIAVLSVVIFHFEKAWLPGGFLGVDAFFVISGFLITSILLRETEQGTYSIARFYERRIRRIAPAMIAFLAITSAACALILLPPDLVGFAKSMLATLGFVANFYFWRDGNYFARASEDKPLLHTWTLSVEEQFYIFFPLIIALLATRPRQTKLIVIGTLAALSLSLNIWAERIGAGSPAFYLLPTRAWELGAGALLALIGPCTFRPAMRNGMALASLVLLLASIGFAPDFVPRPIPVPLPAVLAACLLIWTGSSPAASTKHRPAIVHRALAMRLPTAIGLISYSLYLWHWPVIVLWRYFTIEDFTPLTAIPAFIIMLGFAAFSYRVVEKPFRSSSMPRRKVYALSAAGVAVLVAIALGLIANHGLPGRFDAKARTINAAIGSNWHCPVSQTVVYGARNGCLLTAPSMASADAILLGNSHIQMYAPLISDILSERHLTSAMLPLNGCIPQTNLNLSPACIRQAQTNLDATLALPRSKIVIVALVWANLDELVDANGAHPANPQRAFLQGLDALIGKLRASGKQVVLVGPTLRPGFDYPSERSRSLAFGRAIDIPLSISKAQFDAQYGPLTHHFENRADVIFIEPSKAQCDKARCYFERDGKSLFADGNHIAQGALPILRPQFARGLESAR